MESIQDLLKAHDFIIAGEAFVKGGIIISVDELRGHTVNTFRQKAIEKGWIAADRAHPIEKGTDFSDIVWIP